MQVTVNELRVITDRLLAHLESAGAAEIELEADYYWSIPPEERYDVTKDPGPPTMGQLSDD